jgi:hypothetical protein
VNERMSYSQPWKSSSPYTTRRERLFGGSASWKSPSSAPARREDDDETYQVDYSDSQDLPSMRKGSRVRHPSFGAGTVMELSGHGTDVKAAIEFDNVGRKVVVLKYANLEPEWE